MYSLVSLGATVTDETYITGTRRTMINKIMYITSWLCLKIMNINVKKTELVTNDDVDYSYYLGPNYRAEKFTSRIPKIISPHSSLYDIPTMITAFDGNVSFLAGAFMLNVPIMGSLAKKLATLFVPRSGKKAALDDTLKGLLHRTELIETKGEFPPLVIFPEGTTTNNTTLVKFRGGAFKDMRSVQPVTLKYKHGMVHPAIEAIDEGFMVFLLCCTITPVFVELKQLPVFKPNDYLFETHADKGEEKWEIFAWACRDLMCKVGGYGRSEIAWRDKIKVYQYYMGKLDNLTF